MSKLDGYSQLVSSIYDAGLDFERWPIVLGQPADVLQGSSALFGKASPTNTQDMWAWFRIDQTFQQLDVEPYKEHNPLWERAGVRPVESCVSGRGQRGEARDAPGPSL
jgi:hypothetical protein